MHKSILPKTQEFYAGEMLGSILKFRNFVICQFSKTWVFFSDSPPYNSHLRGSWILRFDDSYWNTISSDTSCKNQLNSTSGVICSALHSHLSKSAVKTVGASSSRAVKLSAKPIATRLLHVLKAAKDRSLWRPISFSFSSLQLYKFRQLLNFVRCA